MENGKEHVAEHRIDGIIVASIDGSKTIPNRGETIEELGVIIKTIEHDASGSKHALAKAKILDSDVSKVSHCATENGSESVGGHLEKNSASHIGSAVNAIENINGSKIVIKNENGLPSPLVRANNGLELGTKD